MSPKLPRITASELIRALESDGWIRDRQRGSHVILIHPKKPGTVAVPLHRARDLHTGTISGILKDAGLTPDDLRRLL